MGVTINQSKQQQNHRLSTDSSLSHRGLGGGLNAFYWYQIFALDSTVVEVQDMIYKVEKIHFVVGLLSRLWHKKTKTPLWLAFG